MKNFIVARHGSYDESLNLSPSGESQMKRLAQALKQVLDEGSILLLSSSAPRAIQSSQVLSDEIGVAFENFDELWSDNMHRENTTRAMELILDKSSGFDHVIIMTHLEYSESLPFVFAEKELGMSELYLCSVPKGEAWHINCSKKTCKCIPEES